MGRDRRGHAAGTRRVEVAPALPLQPAQRRFPFQDHLTGARSPQLHQGRIHLARLQARSTVLPRRDRDRPRSPASVSGNFPRSRPASALRTDRGHPTASRPSMRQHDRARRERVPHWPSSRQLRDGPRRNESGRCVRLPMRPADPRKSPAGRDRCSPWRRRGPRRASGRRNRRPGNASGSDCRTPHRIPACRADWRIARRTRAPRRSARANGTRCRTCGAAHRPHPPAADISSRRRRRAASRSSLVSSLPPDAYWISSTAPVSRSAKRRCWRRRV